MTTPLQKAAQAVIYRWELPTLLIDNAIEELRKALDAELQQSVEPVAWATRRFDGDLQLFFQKKSAEREAEIQPKLGGVIPLYLHPPQQVAVTSGERADLILRLAKQWAELDPADPYRADVGQAVSMMEADAQQAKQVPMTPQEIRDWWASENKLEDCDMCKLHDFETVVRAVEERLGIGGEGSKAQPPAPTGWDNGLSQDYCKELGQWLASRPGARQQVKEMFEADAQQAKPTDWSAA